MRSPRTIAAFLAAALAAACPARAEEMRIVAVVNDEPITQSELNQAFGPVYLHMQGSSSPEELAKKTPEIKKQVLEQLIEERLMLQEAKNPKPIEFGKNRIGTPPSITVEDEDVDDMLEDTIARFESEAQFEEALADQGLTVDDLKARFRNQLTIQRLVDREIRSRIIISPTEVTAYFNENKGKFTKPAAVQAAVIVIRPKETLDTKGARDLAQHLHDQLGKGADFYDLANRYSDGPNAKMGGRVGWIEKGKSIKEIDQVLFLLKEGQVSPVIRTPSGFHIFRVESTRPPHDAELDEVKDEIRDRLFREKTAARYQEWIEKLKAGAYISIK